MRAEGVAVLAPSNARRACRRCRADLRPVALGGVAWSWASSSASSSIAGGLGEEAAVEIADALVAAAGVPPSVVHRVEQAAEEVVAVGGLFAVVEQAAEQVSREQADVLGEEGDERLKDEPLGEGAVDLAA